MSSRAIRGPFRFNTTKTVLSGNYTIVNESIVFVNKTVGAATTIALPASQAVASPSGRRRVIVVDGKGDAASNNITVVPAGTDTINGGASLAVSINYGEAHFTDIGGGAWVVAVYSNTSTTLTTPVINGATTAVAANNFDWSTSTGTWKTPTGLNTVGGKQALKVIATPVAAAGAGGGAAGAAALGSANIVTISSDGATKGVKLQTGVAGDLVYVLNTSATAANLFPATGGTINGGGANVGCAIAASKGAICVCTAADTWTVFDFTAHAGAAA